MASLTRREAIGFGVLSSSAVWAALGRANAAEEKDVIFADGKDVLFKIKDVLIERVDRASRTMAATFGKRDKALRMTNLPLHEDIRIHLSYIEPGSANNLPFTWERLEELVGERVSMMLRAGSNSLSVESVATQND
jgi:hypothetical protein